MWSYQTLKSNSIFVNEKGIAKIGEFILNTEKDFPLSKRDIEINIKFGRTFIDVKAVHIKSQKNINGTLVFNKLIKFNIYYFLTIFFQEMIKYVHSLKIIYIQLILHFLQL